MSKDYSKDTDTGKLREWFDDSVNAIDAQTASMITRARNRALEKQGKKHAPWFVLPAGAVATACLFAMIFLLMPERSSDPGLKEIDVELISSSEELEFYEDLEFYEWLDSYEAAGTS